MARSVSVIGGMCFAVSMMALSACSTSRPEVSSQELTSLISGNTIYGVNSQGDDFIQVFSYDGTVMSGAANSRDSEGKWIPMEVGQWEVVDGSLCNRYTEPQARNAGCDRFYRDASGNYRYVTPRGGQGAIKKVVAGHAE